MQARQTLEELRWLLELSERHPLIRGVVGWVDLRSVDVHGQLREFEAREKFVGVRRVAQDEPDPRFLLGEECVRGLEHLRPSGLTYDLLLYPQQLPAVVELAAQLPQQPFVLDHLAKPRIATWTKPGDLHAWRRDIEALAKQDNVCCKLSGMVTEADWRQWRRADFKPYLDVALAVFGPERLMLGSDWPVCLLSGDYADVAGIIGDFCGELSPAEQAAIWGGTARRLIPGHELGVEVMAVGPGVTNVQPGDRCCVEPYINCQLCYSCRRGLNNCCEHHQPLGAHCDGGLRPLSTVPDRKLHRSPNLSHAQNALVETLAIGCHAIDRGGPQLGENALIIGAGPIGLSALEFAKLSGA